MVAVSLARPPPKDKNNITINKIKQFNLLAPAAGAGAVRNHIERSDQSKVNEKNGSNQEREQ